MDLGCPYSEEEKKDMAARCKKYKRHLLEMKEVPDMKIRDIRGLKEPPPSKRVLLPRVCSTTEEPPRPVAVEVYKVERIYKNHFVVVYRKQRPLKKYFVKWTGYTHCTWQYESALINDLGYKVFNKLLF